LLGAETHGGSNAAFWRRLDTPGHDACRLTRTTVGWRIEGSTVFRYEGAPASLAYEVSCRDDWQTHNGQVHGWVGESQVAVTIERIPDLGWALNGTEMPGLDDCIDLDFGFTPATNLLQLRRIALAVGDGADVPVAWIDLPDWTLLRVHQRYERIAERRYAYRSPSFDYSAVIEVDDVGFARTYPDLWVAD
jgi:hypothetical protein